MSECSKMCVPYKDVQVADVFEDDEHWWRVTKVVKVSDLVCLLTDGSWGERSGLSNLPWVPIEVYREVSE